MKIIDENNFVYLNRQPKLKILIYSFVLFVLFSFALLGNLGYAAKTFPKLGKEHSNTFSGPIDSYSRYVEAYYFLQGIDQFDVINGDVPAGKYKLGSGAGIIPNSILMHVLLIPPFLSPFYAICIYMGFLLMCLVLAGFLVFKYAKSRAGLYVAIFTLFLIFAQKYTIICFFLTGNYSIFVFAVFVALSFTDFFEKHPVIGGIIMGLAMVKAQFMFFMFLPFLMQKRFLSVGISVLFVLLSLFVVALQLDKNIIELTMEYLEFGFSTDIFLRDRTDLYVGIFVELINVLGESAKMLSRISTLFFFILASVLVYRFRNANKAFLYAFLSVGASIFVYNYSYNTLNIVYFIVGVLVIISLAKSKSISISKLGVYGMFFIVSFAWFPPTVVGDLYPFLPYQNTLSRLYVLFTLIYLIYDYNKCGLWQYLKPNYA